jgi:GntR family transcriptional regulator/MocR family aminotransferase
VVLPDPTAFARPAEFDFRTGLPDVALFPFETWRRLLTHQLRQAAVGSGSYAHPAGHQGLRSAIARHIRCWSMAKRSARRRW